MLGYFQFIAMTSNAAMNSFPPRHGFLGYKPGRETMQPWGAQFPTYWILRTSPPVVIKSLLITGVSNSLKIIGLLMVGIGAQFIVFYVENE